MNKFIIFFLLTLVFNSLYANEYIFISPKVSLKMIDKKEITFLALNDSPLKIKKSKIVNMKTLESSDILGRTGCPSFYLCATTLEKYFSSLGIKPNEALVLYDNSYGIDAATLYALLESMGHKNITILRGGLKDISKLDPNWEIYNNYLNEFKKDNSKSSKIAQKINILKPHLLLQESTHISTVESNYTVIKTNKNYLLGRDTLKKAVRKVQQDESNISIIDVCEMIDIVNVPSYKMKSLSWRDLIDKEKKHLKSNEVLEKLFNKLKLNKDEQHYIYCMSGAQKAFYVMMALRELGYSKVKAFAGDWNTWEGDINE